MSNGFPLEFVQHSIIIQCDVISVKPEVKNDGWRNRRRCQELAGRSSVAESVQAHLRRHRGLHSHNNCNCLEKLDSFIINKYVSVFIERSSFSIQFAWHFFGEIGLRQLHPRGRRWDRSLRSTPDHTLNRRFGTIFNDVTLSQILLNNDQI